jgi:hypothetical protein
VQLSSSIRSGSSACRPGRRRLQKAQLQSVESVACLVDSYLSLGKFQALAELLPESARVCHDGMYRVVVPESASGGDGARAEAAMPVDCRDAKGNCRSVAGGAHARGKVGKEDDANVPRLEV